MVSIQPLRSRMRPTVKLASEAIPKVRNVTDSPTMKLLPNWCQKRSRYQKSCVTTTRKASNDGSANQTDPPKMPSWVSSAIFHML